MKMTVESFTDVRSKVRQPNELIEKVKNLQPKQKAVLDYSAAEDSAVDLDAQCKNLANRLRTEGVLEFSPNIRKNMDARIIEIYRDEGSNWAKDKDGQYYRDANGRRMKESDIVTT